MIDIFLIFLLVCVVAAVWVWAFKMRRLAKETEKLAEGWRLAAQYWQGNEAHWKDTVEALKRGRVEEVEDEVV